MTVQLTINGEIHQVPDALTVRGLLEHLELTAGPVAVEVNRAIIPRAEHASHPLTDGDTLELVHLVGGG